MPDSRSLKTSLSPETVTFPRTACQRIPFPRDSVRAREVARRYLRCSRHRQNPGMVKLVPTTVDVAVRVLMQVVPDEEQRAIGRMSEDEMHVLSLGLGMWMRNAWKMWQGNEELIADTGALDPDGASAVIIRTFWTRLRHRDSSKGHKRASPRGGGPPSS